MGLSWYKKSLPRIADISPVINKTCEQIKNLDDVSSVYIFGSYAENHDHPNKRIKDVDIIAVTSFHSEDLLSLTEDTLTCKSDLLEEQGFDPDCVKFSKAYTNIATPNIDHWVISSDQKLLHWGPMLTSREESDEINLDAEKYAETILGCNIRTAKKPSETQVSQWYRNLQSYVQDNIDSMPSGWYISDSNVSDILKNAVKMG